MKISLLLIIFLVIPLVSSFEIVEFTYNPEGQDNNKEYIEIKTELDLTGFIIQDMNSEDTLEKIKNSTKNIALIVEEGFDMSNIDANIYSAGSTIGNNLNNDEDFIIIKNSSEILDVLHYYGSWGANGNGKSLCKDKESFNWKECINTPGLENIFSISTYNLIINELFPNPEGEDDLPMPNGEFIEIFNKENFEINLENYIIRDNSNREIFITNQNTESTIILPNSYLVVYTNGFNGLLNNDDFEKITLLDSNENIVDSISYSETKEGLTLSLYKGKWVFTQPSPNKENYKEDENSESKIKIKKVNNENIHFGDLIEFKVEIYKGSTSKKIIEAFIESDLKRVSETTKISLDSRFENYELTLPIKLDSNCENDLDPGKYSLIVKGLGDSDKESINILDSKNCEQIIKLETTDTPILKSSESNIKEENNPTEIIYESKSTNSKKSALLLFCLVLIMIILQVSIENGNKSKNNN